MGAIRRRPELPHSMNSFLKKCLSYGKGVVYPKGYVRLFRYFFVKESETYENKVNRYVWLHGV